MDLEIIYEDEYLVIINKPSGLVVHPGNGVSSGTLANGLAFHFSNLSKLNDEELIDFLDKIETQKRRSLTSTSYTFKVFKSTVPSTTKF